MADGLKGWELLHSKLPEEAIKSIPQYVYNVPNLSDVNEGFLIKRLWDSGLDWHTEILRSEYLGSEERTNRKGEKVRWYLTHVDLRLHIDGKYFDGSGGHDNMKLDASWKGARTTAFKACCKDAGLTTELWMDGKAIDDINLPPDVSGTPSAPAPAQPPAAQPTALVLSEAQRAEMARLVNTLPQEAQKDARKAAFEAAKAASLRNPATAFEAGRSLLLGFHSRFCGKSDCEHVAA